MELLKKLELNSSKESIKRQSSLDNNSNRYILAAHYNIKFIFGIEIWGKYLITSAFACDLVVSPWSQFKFNVQKAWSHV